MSALSPRKKRPNRALMITKLATKQEKKVKPLPGAQVEPIKLPKNQEWYESSMGVLKIKKPLKIRPRIGKDGIIKTQVVEGWPSLQEAPKKKGNWVNHSLIVSAERCRCRRGWRRLNVARKEEEREEECCVITIKRMVMNFGKLRCPVKRTFRCLFW